MLLVSGLHLDRRTSADSAMSRVGILLSVETKGMKRALFSMFGFIKLFAIAGFAQEKRNEVSFQGTGFLTKNTNTTGFKRTSTTSGGLLVGYKYRVNDWFALETNYGFTRNTQKYLISNSNSRIQSDIHQATIDATFNLPFAIGKLAPYALTGAGALVFHPTGNPNGSVRGTSNDARGAFLYGGGVRYAVPFMRNVSLLAEYRGLVYKDADFNLASLRRSTWTHSAQPSAGFVYRF